MRRPALTAIAVLVGAASMLEARGDASTLFREGGERFERATRHREEHPSERGDISRLYREAAELFEAAWKAGAATTEVFTNTANSYFFAGDTGEAVLFYRRALAASPGNGAARDALEHARSTLPIRRESSGVSSLSESLFFWHDEKFFLLRVWTFYVFFPAAWILFAVELTRRRWRWIHALLVFVVPLALCAWVFSYLFGLRRPYATVGALCLLPAAATLASLAIEAIDNRAAREAVVLVEVQGRNGNGESYTPSHTRPFPPGTEVEVVDRRTGGSAVWTYVRLLDGSWSWIPENAIEFVIPR